YAELHFGLSEFGVFTSDPDVARHRQLAAPAQRESVHGGDDGFPAGLETAQAPLSAHGARLTVEGTLFGEVRNIRAGHERLGARPCQDRALDGGIGGEAVDGV